MNRNRGRHVHHLTDSTLFNPCRTCRVRCSGPTCVLCACDLDRQSGEAIRRNVKAAQTPLTGRAQGGPRAGIKLTASARWDGKLEKHIEKGHYAWRDGVWQWYPAIPSQRRDGRLR